MSWIIRYHDISKNMKKHISPRSLLFSEADLQAVQGKDRVCASQRHGAPPGDSQHPQRIKSQPPATQHGKYDYKYDNAINMFL